MAEEDRVKRTGRVLPEDLARLAWSAAGAGVGLGLAFSCAGMPASPVFLASLGGSAVFLFGLPRAAAAQPRALLGGHLGCALIGILCFQAFGEALWVYPLSLALSLFFMLSSRTAHPPAGANALIMIHGHAGLAALWQPMGAGIIALALTAVVWGRLVPGMVRYPRAWLEPFPPTIAWGIRDGRNRDE
jgi:CBS-domain-containing membrane protein